MKKLLIAVVASMTLSACAVPMKSSEMKPQFDFYDSVSSEKFEDNIYIRNVKVLEKIGGMSPVIPEDYKAALVSAFRQADLYETKDKARYVLDAMMTDMRQPVLGFNMTVTATADYTIFKKINDEVVFMESISVPCTKGVGDAFNAGVRLRLASGCAVGENITHLIKVISNE